MDVIINSYTVNTGGTTDKHNLYKPLLEDTINRIINKPGLEKVEYYDMSGNTHTHDVGKKGKYMIIFNDTGYRDSERYDASFDFTIGGIKYPKGTRLYKWHGGSNSIKILNDEGLPVAEWFSHNYQLNILLDLFPSNKNFDISYVLALEAILKQVQAVIDEEENEFFWGKTNNRQKLKNSIRQMIESDGISRKRDRESQLNNDESRIVSLRRDMKIISDRIASNMRYLSSEENFITEGYDKIVKDLNSIIGHEKIDDIKIDGNKFIAYTKDLIITSSKGRRYIGGNFKIEINMNNSDIRFFGSEKKRGFWTREDGHPHVNGRNGEPCWGSLGSTIAELCSQKELFALVIFCIDFLESANIEDAAGRYVKYYQEIDENGNYIERHLDRCDNCGSDMEDGESRQAFMRYYECHGELEEEVHVCEDCLEEDFSYEDIPDAYVSHWIEMCDDCYEEDEESIF